MRVTSEVKEATEKAIRNAARRLFVRKGLEATSTREIAAAAEIGTGTLFNYFQSKEALAVAIAAEAFAEGRAAAAKRLDRESHGAVSATRRGAGPGTGPRVGAATGSASGRRTLEEDLFTLIACDIRALEPIRSFMSEVLEAGLSPFASAQASVGFAGGSTGAAGAPRDGVTIRNERLDDAVAILSRHKLADAATAPVMHLYWSLYLGVLSYWAADNSRRQENTWALLDQSVRMFTGALTARRSSHDDE